MQTYLEIYSSARGIVYPAFCINPLGRSVVVVAYTAVLLSLCYEKRSRMCLLIYKSIKPWNVLRVLRLRDQGYPDCIIMCFFFSVLSDFGYEHPDIDEVCVATSSANPIPNPCPEGKTYLHSRGWGLLDCEQSTFSSDLVILGECACATVNREKRGGKPREEASPVSLLQSRTWSFRRSRIIHRLLSV